MVYLSDVADGGSTAFPKLNVAIQPVKGDAVFWYNLHLDGSGDPMTLHGGCPVLAGSKWVANKWIHELGNERDGSKGQCARMTPVVPAL
jgi:prolyl 4-hydroxylase